MHARGFIAWLPRAMERKWYVDEVYLDFKKLNGGKGFPHAFSCGNRMISVASLTKVYGFPRLRVGWMIARKELIRRTAPLYDYTVGDPSGPSAALGVAALARRRELRAAAAAKAEENGRLVRSWMEDRDELEWKPPDAGIVAFPRFRRETDSDRFVSFAREKHRVLPAPGGYFEDTRGFRIGFGIDRSRLPEALERLGTALSEWA